MEVEVIDQENSCLELEGKAGGGSHSQKGWWTRGLDSVSKISYIMGRGQHKRSMCHNSGALPPTLGPWKRGVHTQEAGPRREKARARGRQGATMPALDCLSS